MDLKSVKVFVHLRKAEFLDNKSYPLSIFYYRIELTPRLWPGF
jgi:hypothetical protein